MPRIRLLSGHLCAWHLEECWHFLSLYLMSGALTLGAVDPLIGFLIYFWSFVIALM